MATNREVAEQAGAKVHEPDGELHEQMSARARQELGAFFDELERRGNTREELFDLLETTFASTERIGLMLVGRIPAETHAALGRNVMLGTVIARVLAGSPMYESRALRLQLEEQLEQLLASSPGVEVGEPPANDATAEPPAEAPAERRLSGGKVGEFKLAGVPEDEPADSGPRVAHYTMAFVRATADEHAAVRLGAASSVVVSAVRGVERETGKPVDVKTLFIQLRRAIEASREATAQAN